MFGVCAPGIGVLTICFSYESKNLIIIGKGKGESVGDQMNVSVVGSAPPLV